MSSMAMMDTPMLDFSDDPDISMGASSTENWFHSPSHMEEDGQIYEEVSHHGYVEVDMMADGETAEYEMADEIDDLLPSQGPELLDTELYDISVAPSPGPQNSRDMELTFEEDHSAPVIHDPVVVSSTIETTPSTLPKEDFERRNNETSEATEQNLELIQSSTHVNGSPISTAFAAPTNINESNRLLPALHEPASGSHELVEKEDTPGSDTQSRGQSETTKLQAQGTSDDTAQHSTVLSDSFIPVEAEAIGTLDDSEAAGDVNKQQHNNDHLIRSEKVIDMPVIEANTISEGIYMDPPPPILLSLRLTSSEGEQPDFTLFSAPDAVPAPTEGAESSHGTSEEPLVLLQHRPTLYYEPISAVFEALRQEEYFSHLEELVEAEMALNAYDLQLVVSEDNVYAREVSLHDFNAMHDIIGLTGPLRVTLQSIVPRFITRYNTLRDQITRLTLSVEADEGPVNENGDREEGDFVEDEESVLEEANGESDVTILPVSEDQQDTFTSDIDKITHDAIPTDGAKILIDDKSTGRSTPKGFDCGTLHGKVQSEQTEEGLTTIDGDSFDDENPQELDVDAQVGDDLHSVIEVAGVAGVAVDNAAGDDLAGYDDLSEPYEEDEGEYDDEFAGDVEDSASGEQALENAEDLARTLTGHDPADLLKARGQASAGDIEFPSFESPHSSSSNVLQTEINHSPVLPFKRDHNTDHYSQSQIEKPEGNGDPQDAVDNPDNDDVVEDISEGTSEESDAASQAALLESEKFIEMLSHEIDETDHKETSFTNEGTHNLSSNMPPTDRDNDNLNLTTEVVKGEAVIKKESQRRKSIKRSFVETEHNDSAEDSPPSSPGSKRARVQ